MNEVTETMMNISNNSMKITDTLTPNRTEIINGNRVQRTSSKNPVSWSSESHRPSKRDTILNHGTKNNHDSFEPTLHLEQRSKRRVSVQEYISSIKDIRCIATSFPYSMTTKPEQCTLPPKNQTSARNRTPHRTGKRHARETSSASRDSVKH